MITSYLVLAEVVTHKIYRRQTAFVKQRMPVRGAWTASVYFSVPSGYHKRRMWTTCDLLYLHPPNYGPFHYFLLPVGTAGLMNELRKRGYQVRGFNLGLERYLERSFYLPSRLAQLPSSPVVAMDIHWYEHLAGALDIVHWFREHRTSTFIVAGGYTASVFAEQLIEAGVDFVVKGDSEGPLFDLVEALASGRSPRQIPNVAWRSNGHIVNPRPTFAAHDLDPYDYADFSFLASRERYLHTSSPQFRPPFVTLYAGRGCVWNCLFCEGGRGIQRDLFGRQATLRRDPQRLIEEINYLTHQGVMNFKPNMDLFLLGPKFWQPFFQGLRCLRPKVGLHHEFWHVPSDAFLEEMAASVDLEHTVAVYSPLSGDEEVRRKNGKSYSNEQLFRSLRKARDLGVRVELSYSPYLPFETDWLFLKTLRQIWQAEAITYPLINDYSCYPIMPDPGVRLSPSPYGQAVNRNELFQHYLSYSKVESFLGSLRKKLGLYDLGYRVEKAHLPLMLTGYALTMLGIKLRRRGWANRRAQVRPHLSRERLGAYAKKGIAS